MRMPKAAASGLCTAALIGAVVTAAPPATAASSCYGDYCSGKNPATTRAKDGHLCSEGAKRIANAPSPVYADPRYQLYIVWSPRCRTNWALWKGPHAPYVLQTQQSGGYKQTHIYGSAGSWYTGMIYSQTRSCRGYGYIKAAGPTSSSYTAWV